jgi:hypothetical protein
LFFTIRSSVHTLRNFRISAQFSWIFLFSSLLHTANPLPPFSPISSLVFLVKILVNGRLLCLRVLGLHSPRKFGVSSSLLMKKILQSLPSFPLGVASHTRGRNGVFIAPFFLIMYQPLFSSLQLKSHFLCLLYSSYLISLFHFITSSFFYLGILHTSVWMGYTQWLGYWRRNDR